MLDAGLASKLEDAGYKITLNNALQDGPKIWQPSAPEPNGARNEAVNVEVYRKVKETVSAGLSAGSVGMTPLQLVLGGGCDIVPATMSSYWNRISSSETLGLIYIEAVTDLVKPGQPGSIGTLASMTMTHLTMNEGALESMNENVVLFGLNLGAAGNTKEQLGYLLDENFQVFTSAAVAKNPVGRAKQALEWMEGRVDRVFVHPDVPNFTCAGFEDIMKALNVFLQSRKTAGLVIAEANPDHEPGATMTRQLVDAVVKYLAARRG